MSSASQADSASSILVTRSREKAQVAAAVRKDSAPTRTAGSNSRPELADLPYIGQLLIVDAI